MKHPFLAGCLLAGALLSTACMHGRKATMLDDLPDQAFVPPVVLEAQPVNVEQARRAASDGLFWFANPCWNSRGKPFRTRHSFALDEKTGIIYSRVKESAVPVEEPDKAPGGLPWESVTQYFQVKGIARACGGEPAKAPSAPSVPAAPAVPDEEAPEVQAPAGSFQAPINFDASLYYGHLPTDPQGDSLFKRRLSAFLGSAHIQKADAADIVAQDCPADLDRESVCVKPRQIGYKAAREMMFGHLDLRRNSEGDDEVFDYYCQQWRGKKDFAEVTNDERDMPGPSRIVHVRKMNCEHVFPQSKFPAPKNSAENLRQKTDLHHLFSVDTQVNAARSHFDFAEVEPAGAQAMKCADGRLGKPITQPSTTADGAQAFEPPRAFKGEVARALAYFAVRYNAGMSSLQEYYVRKWNRENPPGEREIARHEKIYRLIGVRNPFIDHPDWLDRVSRLCRERLSEKQTPTTFDCAEAAP
ncbi:MAG: endonuclease [Bdellovibrionaceae bacterium]|nr:endonuclease [Pseudobdellovibrionaceae bacterium]